MSVFSPVKTIILANLSEAMPNDLRKATVEAMEALDNDLDVANYIPSSGADDKFEKFQSVLEGIDEIGQGDDDATPDKDEDDEDEISQDDDEVDAESEEDEEEDNEVEGLDIPVDDDEDDDDTL